MTAFFCPDSGLLRHGPRHVTLTDQTRRGLTFFCQHEGRVISRQELSRACWESRGLVVTDANVRQTVYRLRCLFRTVALEEDILETCGKAGYMLAPGHICLQVKAAPPQNNIPANSPAAKPPAAKSRNTLPWRRILLVSICGMLALLAGAGLRSNHFITPVDYRHRATQEGRHFYLASTHTGAPGDAVSRIKFWLTWDSVSLKDSRHVYINGRMNGYLSALLCDRPITERDSLCRALTVLGDHHR